MFSNAVLSARNLDWRDSMAFDPDLAVPMDHLSIYQLNSAAAMGDHAVDELHDLITGRMDDSAQGTDWKQCFKVSEKRLNDIRVNDLERCALVSGAERMGRGHKHALMSLEKTFAENGYGVPAIAVLIVLVVVVVAVVAHQPGVE